MTVVFVLWLLTLSIGAGVWVVVWRYAPEAGGTALRLSALASFPSLLPLGEYLVRSLHDAPERYVVRWPFFIGCMFGVVLLIGSFLDAPSRDLHGKWQLARLFHVFAWATESIVSVAMLLDV